MLMIFYLTNLQIKVMDLVFERKMVLEKFKICC